MRRRSQAWLLILAGLFLAALVLLVGGKQILKERTGNPAYQVQAAETDGEEGLREEMEDTSRPVLQSDTEEGAASASSGGRNPEEPPMDDQAAGSRPVRLLFGGDIYLSDHVLNAWQRGGGIEGILDSGFRQEIEQADIFMANQEFPFSSRGTPESDKQFTFRLPEDKVSVLQAIGPDIVALANNHALDYGEEALLDTCRVLDSAGILHAGAGEDLDAAK